jgi:hypothetical protein
VRHARKTEARIRQISKSGVTYHARPAHGIEFL